MVGGEEARGHGRDRADDSDTATLIRVELLGVGGVLLDVDVDLALGEREVVLDEIGHLDDLERVAVLLEDRDDRILEQHGVRALGLAVLDVGLLAFGLCVAAAGATSQSEGEGCGKCRDLIQSHDVSLSVRPCCAHAGR